MLWQIAVNQTESAWLRISALKSRYAYILSDPRETSPSMIVASPLEESSLNKLDPTRNLCLLRISSSMNSRSGNLTAPFIVASPSQSACTSVAMTLDASLVAVGHKSGSIDIMDTLTVKVLQTLFGHDDSVLSLCFLPELTFGSNKDPIDKQMNLDSTTSFMDLICPTSEQNACTMIIRLGSTSQDSTVCVWELLCQTTTRPGSKPSSPFIYTSAVGRRIHLLTLPWITRAVTTSAWHTDRQEIVVAGHDGQVVFWPLKNATGLGQPHGSTIRSLIRPRMCVSTPLRQQINTIALKAQAMHSAGKGTYLPEDDLCAAGCWDGTIVLLHCASPTIFKAGFYSVLMHSISMPSHCILTAHSTAVCSLAYLDKTLLPSQLQDHSSSLLASLDYKGSLFLWSPDHDHSFLGQLAETSVKASDNTLSSALPAIGLSEGRGALTMALAGEKFPDFYLVQSGGSAVGTSGKLSVWNAGSGTSSGM
ncbi:unnamed protein product [Protopolystoma xenopodis]|uniref:Uncharacterized protein n=1 Tax=Protopolystoma xenopodis TaxID=117903 RepID=A0A448XGW1_9PLAT|nr:unnamed protein product [Protopolystoma xenopodis]